MKQYVKSSIGTLEQQLRARPGVVMVLPQKGPP
jgi:hypothetical protein